MSHFLSRLTIAFLSLIFVSNFLSAQNNPLSISIVVSPPYSMEAIDYFSDPNQTSITILNPTNQSFSVYLAGSLKNISTEQSVTIPNNVVPAVPPLIIDPGTKFMTGADLRPFVNEAGFQFNGISQADVINGNLPEGNYQICLQAYDYTTKELRSQGEPLGCSNIFTIQFVQPPILISPQCSTEVTYSTPQNIVFTWIPPQIVMQPGLLNYEFKLVEVPFGMNAIQAMNSTGVPVLVEQTSFTSFLYSALSPALNPGRHYAWRIKVTDLTNQFIFANDGVSEICEFTYGLPFEFDSPLTATFVYPVPGKRYPFINSPLIVRTQPFDTSSRGYSASTEIRENNSLFDHPNISGSWPGGRFQNLQSGMGFPPDLIQLEHFDIGRNLTSGPVANEFKANRDYSVNSTITFTNANSTQQQVNVTGAFKGGFEKPLLKSPSLDTTFKRNVVNFKFLNSDTVHYSTGEMGLIPSPAILKSLSGASVFLFKAEVKQRYRIEIATDQNFGTIVLAASDTFHASKLVTKTTTTDEVKQAIYKTISKELLLPDTGVYYWRVHWLTDYADSASAPYQTSEVIRFRVSDGPRQDVLDAACIAQCNAPAVTNRTAVAGLLPNQKVQVGLFEMEIKTIQYSGQIASGTGVIKVPFLNSTIKVDFREALINSERKLIDGVVVAAYDTVGFNPVIPGIGRLTIDSPGALMKYIENGHSSALFDPTVPTGLPFGLDRDIEGERVTLGIVGMNFGPERATLAAAISFPLPFLVGADENEQLGITPSERASDGGRFEVGLGASNICFHPAGLAGLGVATLYLAAPFEIDYAPGQYFKLNAAEINPASGTVGDSGTYVNWDCQGVRFFHIDGEITFDSTVLKSVALNGSKALNPVTAKFGFNAYTRSGNWLAALDFSPFQIPGVDDWNFQVEEASIDLSDVQNPATMVFPRNYQGDRSVLWNGFHLKSLKVGLPKKFKLRTPDTDVALTDSVLKGRVVIAINDLLIDKTGVTLEVEALRVLEMENGILGNWAFSMDTVKLEFVSNSFASGGFSGRITTPLSPTVLKYGSVLSQGSRDLIYQFNVHSMDTLEVPLWAAKMKVLPSSFVAVNVTADGFNPELTLNGSVGIVGKIGEIPVTFAGVNFEQLKITTAEPFISCHNFAFASPQKDMAGFPVSVSNITLGTQDFHGLFSWDGTPGSRIALNFQVDVNFTGETNTFSGNTTLAILGRFDAGNFLTAAAGEEVKLPSLVLSGIDLKTINIQGDLGFVALHGFINFFAEDSIYGQGFMGGIEATFIKTVTVSVLGSFGEINNMRYWYADAMAKFVPGIPMGIAPYQIPMDFYGFGGGAFYKMKMQTVLPPTTQLATAAVPATPPPGTTLSRVKLVPDPASFFGLKATVVIGTTGGGTAFNADLTLTVVINNSGGVSSVAFDGTGYFMSSVMDRTFTNVRAGVILQYDFQRTLLTGNFEVMVNVPLTIKGSHPGNIAGNAFLYSGTDKWQLFIGQPAPQSAQVGLILGGLFNANGYLMAGKQLPPPPPTPTKVNAILGPVPTQRTPGIATGKAYAFGASFSPPHIRQNYSPFYCELDAQIGFDLTHTEYEYARCDGMKIGDNIGVNGWYSTGTGWGYFDGSLGIIASIFGDNTKYEILDVEAAVLLQSGYSNPQWYRGTLGGNYSILGGLIKGNCRFDLQQGQFCEPPPESPISGIRMISETNPHPNESDVDCGIKPSAAFNIDLERRISFTETSQNGTSIRRTFTFNLETLTLKKGNQLISDNKSISPDKAQAMLNVNSMLEAFTTYRFTIKVVAREYLPDGNVIYARKNDGSKIEETVVINFTTGALPDKIRDQDIKYCSPLSNQRYFVMDGMTEGAIRLRQNMNFLFTGVPRQGYDRTYHAQFEPVNGGPVSETTARHSSTPYNQESSVRFAMPAQLIPNTIYRIRIIHRDTRNNDPLPGIAVGGQVVQNAGFQVLSNSTISFANGSVLVRNRQLEGPSVLQKNEHLIYEYYFRTSMHTTYAAKIASLSAKTATREFIDPSENLLLTFEGPEGFESYEVNGFTYYVGFTPTIIRILNITDNYSNTWHTGFLNSTMYRTYFDIANLPVNGHLRIPRSNPDVIGLPPNRIDGTIFMPGPLSISEIFPSQAGGAAATGSVAYTPSAAQQAAENITSALTVPTQQLVLPTSFYARMDYYSLRSVIADIKSRFGNNMNGLPSSLKTKINTFWNTPYNYMSTGNYDVYFVTPGNATSIRRTFNYAPVYQVYIIMTTLQ